MNLTIVRDVVLPFLNCVTLSNLASTCKFLKDPCARQIEFHLNDMDHKVNELYIEMCIVQAALDDVIDKQAILYNWSIHREDDESACALWNLSNLLMTDPESSYLITRRKDIFYISCLYFFFQKDPVMQRSLLMIRHLSAVYGSCSSAFEREGIQTMKEHWNGVTDSLLRESGFDKMFDVQCPELEELYPNTREWNLIEYMYKMRADPTFRPILGDVVKAIQRLADDICNFDHSLNKYKRAKKEVIRKSHDLIGVPKITRAYRRSCFRRADDLPYVRDFMDISL